MSPILPDNLLDRLDGIIAFLPWFETLDFKFGHWVASRPEEPDTLIFPYFSFSHTASKFVQAAYAFGPLLPRVKLRHRATAELSPLYPQQQTSSDRPGLSVWCQ
jgi:hypothetical protein